MNNPEIAKLLDPASAVAVVNPADWISPTPSATSPKLPKDEFELVTSHAPPDPQNIPTSVAIVKKETIWPYPPLVIDAPIPP